MKHFYKFLSVVALVAVSLTGCVKEQSSFSPDDVPGRATIIGSYHYDAGQGYDYDDESYIRYIKPLANHTVYALVDNSTLKTDSKGYTVYETTTDKHGEFKISVPVTLTGTTVKVYAKTFLGKRQEVVGVEDNEPIFENPDVVYKAAEKTYSLKADDIVFHDAICTVNTGDEREETETYPYTWTFTVKVGEGVYHKVNNYSYQVLYNNAEDVNVLATVDGHKYGATTNAKGIAKFVIPATEKVGSAVAYVEIKPYLEENFTHLYFQGSSVATSILEKGTYEMYNGGSNTVPSISQSLTFVEFSNTDPNINVNMVFIPFDGIANSGGYNIYTWINDYRNYGPQN